MNGFSCLGAIKSGKRAPSSVAAFFKRFEAPGGGFSGNVSGSPDVYTIPQSSMERTHVTELLALAEKALGSRLDEGTRRSLRRIQRDFLSQQTQLVCVLDLGVISPEEYLGQLNVLMKGTMARMETALGRERFIAVFGDAGRHPERMVDRDAFMQTIAAERASAQSDHGRNRRR